MRGTRKLKTQLIHWISDLCWYVSFVLEISAVRIIHYSGTFVTILFSRLCIFNSRLWRIVNPQQTKRQRRSHKFGKQRKDTQIFGKSGKCVSCFFFLDSRAKIQCVARDEPHNLSCNSDVHVLFCSDNVARFYSLDTTIFVACTHLLSQS